MHKTKLTTVYQINTIIFLYLTARLLCVDGTGSQFFVAICARITRSQPSPFRQRHRSLIANVAPI